MKWRFATVFFLLMVFFALIWGRLFYWQVVKAEELSAEGQAQSQVQMIEPSKRGDILASDGFPLVTNIISYLLYANPQAVKNKNETSKVLSGILNVDDASISARLSDTDKVWVTVDSRVDKDTKKEIEDLKIPGLGFEEIPTRFYPEASLAAQLVGFVGKDENGLPKGYFGLEGFYERQLRGRQGNVVITRDAFGKPILTKLSDSSGQQDGRTLTLTIDRVIQFQLEQKLKKGVEDYGAQSGMAAVMDPKTGSILAMASSPTFDPSTYWNFDDNLYKNPFISNTYEPGSTFKPIVMAAAMEQNLIKPDTICDICSGPVQINDYSIKTWNDKYFPNTDMIDVIIHSDNTGMVFVSKKMGLDRMLNMLNEFGIGQETGIDLQGEFVPQLKPRNDWYPIDVATASFGQGISVTPIELLSAFSTIANKGIRMQPHIVSKIESYDGKNIPIEPKEAGHPISEKTAKIMTEILVDAVNKGEANFARIKGYRIAGKTGTASIPVNGHYDPSKTIASFIGFAPADDPKFIMLVIFNRPTTSIYGAETAAPVFFSIAKDILDYYKIPPSGDD